MGKNADISEIGECKILFAPTLFAHFFKYEFFTVDFWMNVIYFTWIPCPCPNLRRLHRSKKTLKIHRYRSNNRLQKNWFIYLNQIDYIINSLSKYRINNRLFINYLPRCSYHLLYIYRFESDGRLKHWIKFFFGRSTKKFPKYVCNQK